MYYSQVSIKGFFINYYVYTMAIELDLEDFDIIYKYIKYRSSKSKYYFYLG